MSLMLDWKTVLSLPSETPGFAQDCRRFCSLRILLDHSVCDVLSSGSADLLTNHKHY